MKAKKTSFRINQELWKQFRMLALGLGRTAGSLLEETIRRVLVEEEEKKKRKKKP